MTDSATDPRTADPYRRCEESCTHDLAAGVLIRELLRVDGPHPPAWVGADGSGRVPGSELRARLVGRESAA
jgi:hypothetical protein